MCKREKHAKVKGLIEGRGIKHYSFFLHESASATVPCGMTGSRSAAQIIRELVLDSTCPHPPQKTTRPAKGSV